MSLRTVRLGKTGLKVTQLGFGGIPIQRLTQDEAVAVVKKTLELGIRFFDTANSYSTSEERIGLAVAGQREKVFIATKTAPVSKEKIRENLNLSLKRLKTEYIDLYQFHGINNFKTLDAILAPDGLLSVLEEARKAGVIKHIGITSHQIDVAKKAVQSDMFETVMFPFNFITSEAAEVLFPECQKHDVGFIAMKPLAGGMVDNAPVCFQYLLQFPDIVFIPGIEKIAEIEEIYRLVNRPSEMTPAARLQMEQIKNELGPRFCHRCDYCQPCTAGIPISMVMSARSFYKRLPPERFFEGMVPSGLAKAADCTQCGKCEERCPYHLPIRQTIAEQRQWFEAECRKFQAGKH
jgi:uncharacterized protein